jgi:hypothetical protein
MANRLRLSERFTVDGAFWRPGDPEHKLLGRLTAEERIEFRTAPAFREGNIPLMPPELMDKVPETPTLLHGFTEQGICTLFGLHYVNTPGLSDLGLGVSVTSELYQVDLCVFGLHVPSLEAEYIESSGFSLTGLQRWLPKADRTEAKDGSVIHSVPMQSLKIVQAVSVELAAQIIVEVFALRESTNDEGKRQIWSHPRIRIVPQSARSLQWFYPLASRLENFFTLMLGHSVITEAVELFHGKHIGCLVRRRRGASIDGYPHHRIPFVAEQLSSALLRWFALPKEFIPVESLIIATIRNTDVIVESQFLSLAQALEAFHRVTSTTTTIPKSEFIEVLQKVRGAITQACENSPIRERFLNAIAFANEPSFATRLKELVAKLDAQQTVNLLGEAKKFIRQVVDTRNMLTHQGIEPAKNALNEPLDLFLINQRMLAVLRFVVLDYLGLPPTLTFRPVHAQATQWS